jgi:hypothetical protein
MSSFKNFANSQYIEVTLYTSMLFMMHVLVTVSAKLSVVAFESSERKWLSVVDPSAAIVHESEGPNGSGDVEDPTENADKKNFRCQVQSKAQ